MLLRAITLKTLRDQRWAALLWGGATALFVLLTASAWGKAYPDQAARTAIAQQIQSGLSFASVIFGEPRHLEEVPGLIAWRALGLAPILHGLFMVLAASGATRGAEERGELELTLTLPRARARLFAEQCGGLLLALGLSLVPVFLALLVAGPLAKGDPLSAGRSALTLLNLCGAAALFGALALLLAQFCETRRTVALSAGAALVAAQVWDNLGVVTPSLAGARWLSPLHLYSRSSSLADGSMRWAAFAGLLALAVGCATLAGWLFARRDLRAVVRLPLPPWAARRGASGAASAPGVGPVCGRGGWLLRGSVGFGLRGVFGTAIVWGVALGALSVLYVSITRSAVAALQQEEGVQKLLARFRAGALSSDAAFLSLILSTILPLLIAVFAVMLAAAWASEESSGRLDLPLAYPQSRGRYFLARAAAALAAIAIAALLLTTVFVIAVRVAGLDISVRRAIESTLLLVPLAAAIAAFGFAVSTARARLVTAFTGAIVLLSYLLQLLAPLFGWPDTVQRASVFRLYGQPLLNGINQGDLATLCALPIALTLAGLIAFTRKDIAR